MNSYPILDRKKLDNLNLRILTATIPVILTISSVPRSYEYIYFIHNSLPKFESTCLLINVCIYTLLIIYENQNIWSTNVRIRI